MIFRQLFDQTSCAYTYLLADRSSRAAVIIDPVKDKVEPYLQLLQELELNLLISMDTHVHADHITGSGLLREKTGCQVLLGKPAAALGVTHFFEDGETIAVGNLNIKALYTPGHTDDSYCFYLEHGGQSYLFSGDTLLIRGTGRTDFQNGSATDEFQSLYEKILTLPEDTWVYPAHDYKGMTVSTIGEELRYNPRLQFRKMEEYVSCMNNLNLPAPKQIDVAVPANLRSGLS